MDPRDKVIEIVESFPDAVALPVASVHLSLEIRGMRFGWFMENHHGNHRIEINCKALPGVGEAMVEKNRAVYVIPKMVRNRGWGIGFWLDVPGIDWDEIRDLLHDAYVIATPQVKANRGDSSTSL